jgi:hypothetical protein
VTIAALIGTPLFRRFRIISDQEPVLRMRWGSVTHSVSWLLQIGTDGPTSYGASAVFSWKKKEWETVLFGQKLVVIVA